jgi:hypothetical protein
MNTKNEVTKKIKRGYAAFFTASLLLICGCNSMPSTPSAVAKPATSEPTKANVAPQEELTPQEIAVQSIAAVRCDREAACNNLGAGLKYADRAACIRELEHDVRAELLPSECPRGINSKALDSCVASIRTEKCESVLDTLGRLAACRINILCLK